MPPGDTPDLIPTAEIDMTSGNAPVDANAVQLAPPLFSVPTGKFPLAWFPGTVTLSAAPVGSAHGIRNLLPHYRRPVAKIRIPGLR